MKTFLIFSKQNQSSMQADSQIKYTETPVSCFLEESDCFATASLHKSERNLKGTSFLLKETVK